MKTNITRQVGLWLDHSQAHFIDFSKGPAVIETVYSQEESQVRIKGESSTGTQLGHNRSTINEHHVHNREQEIIREYYQVLKDRLKNYDEILLFGSSTAKEELYNQVKADKYFAGKRIAVKPSPHLTENQMVAEVKKYFNI